MKNMSVVSGSILAVVLLSGCATGGSGSSGSSGGGVSAGQSRQEACGFVEDILADVEPIAEADISSPLAKLGVFNALKDLLPELEATAEQITNAEIKASVDGAVKDVNAFIDYASELVADPASADKTELGDHTKALVTRIDELDDLCA